jgi:hypothetical protein
MNASAPEGDDHMSEPGDGSAPAAPTEMLIDRYLTRFDVTLIEHKVVDADVATTWQALRELDLAQVHTPVMDAALFVRAVPARVGARLGRKAPPAPAPRRLLLTGDGLGLEGWLSLGESAEREIAFGAVGRFWQPDIEWYDVSTMTPGQFAAFDEPGWGRIAANLSLRHYGTPRTLASYEARSLIGDPDSARRFARYWTIVRPFVRHIMKAALDTLRRSAQDRTR